MNRCMKQVDTSVYARVVMIFKTTNKRENRVLATKKKKKLNQNLVMTRNAIDKSK